MAVAAPRRVGRTVGIAAAVLVGAGALGTGAYAVYSNTLGGGGPQPESAVPATSMAFTKIDLDPGAGQKIDALRFIGKFPAVPEEARSEGGDIKRALFESIQKDGTFKDLNYETDVKPWLGDRAGMAVFPMADGEDPGVVLALAVTDQDKAKAGLDKAVKGEDWGTACTVQTDFAVCGESQEVVDAAVAATNKQALADSGNYTSDVKALGKDGVAQFWMDAAGVQELVKSSTASDALDSVDMPTGEGRVIGVVRFDSANLEVAMKGLEVPSIKANSATGTGVTELPEGTLAAIGVAGAGQMLTDQWATLTDNLGTDLTDSVNELRTSYDIDLPADLATLLGDQTVVAFGGGDVQGEKMPKIAMVTDTAPDDTKALQAKVEDALGQALGIDVVDKDGHSVFASEAAYADELVAESGLGDADSFTAAVPGASDASIVGYANIRGLIAAYGTDLSSDERENLDPLSAFGISVQINDNGFDATMRLTTK
ncbi:MAG: DUF3352 domain-containing protein [Nostocoides sp.]